MLATYLLSPTSSFLVWLPAHYPSHLSLKSSPLSTRPCLPPFLTSSPTNLPTLSLQPPSLRCSLWLPAVLQLSPASALAPVVPSAWQPPLFTWWLLPHPSGFRLNQKPPSQPSPTSPPTSPSPPSSHSSPAGLPAVPLPLMFVPASELLQLLFLLPGTLFHPLPSLPVPSIYSGKAIECRG